MRVYGIAPGALPVEVGVGEVLGRDADALRLSEEARAGNGKDCLEVIHRALALRRLNEHAVERFCNRCIKRKGAIDFAPLQHFPLKADVIAR